MPEGWNVHLSAQRSSPPSAKRRSAREGEQTVSTASGAHSRRLLASLLFLLPLLMALSPTAVAGTMTWVIYDGCPGREPIRFRFFDDENNGVWPASDRYYYTKRYGEGYRQALECEKGAKVCYGGWQPGAGKYWGVGENGVESCTDCCARCDGDTYEKRLTCK
jgi:hypothetical protein